VLIEARRIVGRLLHLAREDRIIRDSMLAALLSIVLRIDSFWCPVLAPGPGFAGAAGGRERAG
jgi:hypothetical protein